MISPLPFQFFVFFFLLIFNDVTWEYGFCWVVFRNGEIVACFNQGRYFISYVCSC
ncbi:hypothetical protein Gohar_017608 [Gossypium harknessii]|uniref:Uncharacterized protein n=1 Tax=Gossypium harknessii TaxID=34285 RepID=A0A7J9G777_9ROSI|nr:hypothetical protein [Gossypium harknessii]